MDADQPELTLASGSPRREWLLRQAGLTFSVTLPDVEEVDFFLHPEYTPVINAIAKADNVAGRVPSHHTTLAADTIVLLDGVVLGKPTDADDAIRMLTGLSGRQHAVLTSVCVLQPTLGTRCVFTETSFVRFRELTLKEIEEYVADVNPLDRAGAYGAQDEESRLIDQIDGDFENVVGLPLRRTLDTLKFVGRITGTV